MYRASLLIVVVVLSLASSSVNFVSYGHTGKRGHLWGAISADLLVLFGVLSYVFSSLGM